MALKQCIIARTDIKMGKGKIAAQCCHASIEAFLKAQKKTPSIAEEWHATGMQKTVLKAGSEQELVELFESAKRLFPAALIRDAGRTQIEPGTITAVGIGPAEERELDKLTGKMKLL